LPVKPDVRFCFWYTAVFDWEMIMNLSYSLPQPEKVQGAISTRLAFFSERLYFCSARANLGINHSSQSHPEENSHEKVIPLCGPSAERNAFSGGPLHA
jgi:hypothetical protein